MIINVLLAILILSVVIIAHEFGHFIVAKANGVCVVEFSVGFGPRIFAFRIGDTDYCLKALPFGGSCRMLGQEEYILPGGRDEGIDESELSVAEKRSLEMLEKYGKSATLETKSVSARIAILAAGPVFNFLFAIILSVILLGVGGYDPCKIDAVEEGSPAYTAGLREGDLISSVNGRMMFFSREFDFYRMYHEKNALDISYVRDGKKEKTTVIPEEVTDTAYKIGVMLDTELHVAEVLDNSAAKNAGIRVNDKIISINGQELTDSSKLIDLVRSSGGKSIEVVVERAGHTRTFNLTPEIMETTSYETGIVMNGQKVHATPIETLGLAFADTGYRISSVVETLIGMGTGRVSMNNLSGPVGTVSTISSVVGESRKAGTLPVILNMINIAIILSANLGIMNLLPIPALDGGRLVIYIIEAIRGKPVSKKVENVITFIGVVFLLVLMAYILVKDIIVLF